MGTEEVQPHAVDIEIVTKAVARLRASRKH